MPDDIAGTIATIRRMRLAGADEDAIRAATGLPKQQLWDAVNHWNRKNPHDKVPKPARSLRPTHKQRVAALFSQGLTPRQIAERLDIAPSTASKTISVARAEGILPPRPQPGKNGYDTWQALMHKGAAPNFGSIGEIMRRLTKEEANALLARTTTNDRTCAAIIARIVKEALHADVQPR